MKLGHLFYHHLGPWMIKMLSGVLGDRNNSTSIAEHLPKPFFIVGSGRNGSTLLALLLNNNSQLYLPPEQYALPKAVYYWQLMRFYGWNKISRIIVNQFLKNNSDWDFSTKDAEEIHDRLRQYERKHRNLHNLYLSLVMHFAPDDKRHLTYIGDHTPMTIRFIKLILKEIQGSKLIFLVRDPRDVVLSFSKYEDSQFQAITSSAQKWNDSVDKYFWLCEHYAMKDIICIKYEDLVHETVPTMERLAAFLDIPFEINMTRQQVDHDTDPMNIKKQAHHKNLYKPIFTGSVGKWKQELGDDDLNTIKKIVHRNAQRLGYHDWE